MLRFGRAFTYLAAAAVPAVLVPPPLSSAPQPDLLIDLVAQGSGNGLAAGTADAGPQMDPNGRPVPADEGPQMDPDGTQAVFGDAGPQMDPNGLLRVSGDVGPQMDPNGLRADEGPFIDPDGLRALASGDAAPPIVPNS